MWFLGPLVRVLRVEGYADRSAGSPPQVPASTHGPAAEALGPAAEAFGPAAEALGPAADAFVPAQSESAEGTTSLEELFGHTLSAAISETAMDSDDELNALCDPGTGLAGKDID